MLAVVKDAANLKDASPARNGGGLRAFLEHLSGDVFNVPKQTFIATIAFGAKATAPPSNDGGSEEEDDEEDAPFASQPRLCDNGAFILSLLRPPPPSSFLQQA